MNLEPAPATAIPFFAIAAWGIEGVTAAELQQLGAGDVRPVIGGVHFTGDLELLYRASLWLRTATRIVRPLREFAATTPEMLYSQVRRVRWESYLNPEMTFAIHATIQGGGVRVKDGPGSNASAQPRTQKRGGRNDRRGGSEGEPRRPGLNHSQYAALKIKDAIVDRLRREQGERPNVDTENPDLPVHAHFAGGRCTLSLDATGASLHERGYRLRTTGAPLKETLAAAIVDLTGWDGKVPFLDPMCGGGTLPIEAALKVLRIAPGLKRTRFPFQCWPDYSAATWERVRAEAAHARRTDVAPVILASDRDPQAITAARENAARAGVADQIQFSIQAAETLTPGTHPPGVIVVNPPYGERLGQDEDLAELYGKLGDNWKQQFAGWTAHLLAGNLPLARTIGLRATEKIKLFNSALECRLLKFPLFSGTAEG